MSYYMGDYYQGDYYQGDPGFFSFLGGIAKKAIGMIPGVGPVASALLPSGGGGAMVKAAAVLPATSKLARAGAAMKKVGPIVTGIAKSKGGKIAMGAGALGAAGAVGAALGRRGMRPVGAHHRRMNVCNPRALRRAIRRTHGFAKLAMKTIHLVHPKKKVRFGGFRKRRAKR
jgi:hypothetical protein